MDSVSEITIGDKHFILLIPHKEILNRIKEIAVEMNRQLSSNDIDIIVVMDGADTFAKAIQPLLTCKHRLHQIRIKTYDGMNSKSAIHIDSSLIEKMSGNDVFILEDIIDSGHTVFKLMEYLKEWNINKVRLATLLYKPMQLKYPVRPDFTGFEIGPDFVVGFGMDYNEEGRELDDIYRCINP